jgi:hypothetical protein
VRASRILRQGTIATNFLVDIAAEINVRIPQAFDRFTEVGDFDGKTIPSAGRRRH